MSLDVHVRTFITLMVLSIGSVMLTRWLLKGTSLFESFERRRNYWLAAIVIMFVATNIFVGLALIGLMLFWAARKDPMPIGVYLMFVIAIPPAHATVQGIGPIQQFFTMTSLRMLSLAILLPLAIRMIHTHHPGDKKRNLSPRFTDIVISVLAVYILICFAVVEAPTQLLRRAFHIFTDILLPYFVVSRYLRDRESVKDALGALLISGLLLAPIAAFEHFRTWLLYETVYNNWAESVDIPLFLMRGSTLRAPVSSGHALVFGHFLVVCMGLLGIFRLQIKGYKLAAIWLILAVGLYATVSRGPWLAGAVVVLSMGIFTGRILKFYALAGFTVAASTAALLMSPYGEKVVSYMPFIGSVDLENVEYRSRLADASWLLIQQNPWFGNVSVLSLMEDMRQGQGIIDLVNVYLDYALHFGLIGASLLSLFLLSGIYYGLKLSVSHRKVDREMFFMAGNTAVALLGSAFLLIGISDFNSVPRVYSALVAALVAMARLSHLSPAQQALFSTTSQGITPTRAVVIRP